MKRTTVFTFCALVGMILFASQDNYAQTRNAPDAGSASQEQVMQSLLDEVHQLRLAVQHISVNAYRGQVMVERLRLQHELVDRLARELDGVKKQIVEVRAEQPSKDTLEEAEKQQESGVISRTSLNKIRASVEEGNRRGQNLSERESQLAAELATERANLADLNNRLDALEREMLMDKEIDKVKQNKKR